MRFPTNVIVNCPYSRNHAIEMTSLAFTKGRRWMLKANRGLPEDMKQPAFEFYGRPLEKEGAFGGGKRGRRLLLVKDPFLWLINRISSSQATV